MKIPKEEPMVQLEGGGGFENNQGPIDGVIPSLYPATYLVLFERVCLTQLQPVIYWSCSNNFGFCAECHTAMDAADDIILDFIAYTNWHVLSPTIQYKCWACGTRIFKMQSAVQCRECVEEFLLNSNRIYAGEVVEVIPRWGNRNAAQQNPPH